MADIGDIFGGATSETFLGIPAGTLNDIDADVVVFGAPCATPYAATGAYAAGAPAALRTAIGQFGNARVHMDFDLDGPVLGDGSIQFADCGDLAWSKTDHAGNRKTILDATKRILDANAVPVVLGGDDSIPIPFFEAFMDSGPLTVLQIDAHIDWRDEVGGERQGLSSNMRRASEMPHIESIIQIGARGIGSARPSDFADAKAWGVRFLTARELMERGLEAALALVPEDASLLINFDVDALDPAIMPAVIGPAPGGLGYWQVVELIHGAAQKASIAGFSIVEFVPDRDPTGHAALTASRIVGNVLGCLARKPG
ncbi:MAG: arginase family protein [Hyphomicrobiaceae bacterium]